MPRLLTKVTVCLWKRSERERVGGWKVGVCCGVHVLFVNRPAGKKGDTWFYSTSHPETQSEVWWDVAKGEVGRGWVCEGNSICVRL